MSEATTSLDRIPASMRQPIADYAGLIRELAADNARGLAFFGAVTSSGFDPGRHTARNVLLLGLVDLTLLKRVAEHGARFGRTRIAAPLIMTPEYLSASRDTFPLELIEIVQTRVTVFGDDHFDALEFDEAHVRLQAERELKSLQIGLRQGLLAAAGRDRFLDALERDAGEGLLRTLRGLLWLSNDRVGRSADETVAAVEKLIDRRLEGLRTARNSTAQHGWPEFEALYRDVEALGEFVDAW